MLRDASALRRLAMLFVDACRGLVTVAATARRTEGAATHSTGALLDDAVRCCVRQHVWSCAHPLLQPHHLLRLLDTATRHGGEAASTTPATTTTTTVGALYDALLVRAHDGEATCSSSSSHDDDDGGNDGRCSAAMTPSLVAVVEQLLCLSPLVVSLAPSPRAAAVLLACHGSTTTRTHRGACGGCCCCCCNGAAATHDVHAAACTRALRRLRVAWQAWVSPSLRAELVRAAVCAMTTTTTQLPSSHCELHAIVSLLCPSSSSSSAQQQQESTTHADGTRRVAATRVVSLLLRYVPRYFVPLTLVRQHVACDVSDNNDDDDGTSTWQTLLAAVTDAAVLVERSAGNAVRLRADVLQSLATYYGDNNDDDDGGGGSDDVDDNKARATLRARAWRWHGADRRYALLPHHPTLLHHALCVLAAVVPCHYVAVTRIVDVYAAVLQTYASTHTTHAVADALQRRFAHAECLLDHADVAFALQWRRTARAWPPNGQTSNNNNSNDNKTSDNDDHHVRCGLWCAHDEVRLHPCFAHAQRGVADALYAQHNHDDRGSRRDDTSDRDDGDVTTTTTTAHTPVATHSAANDISSTRTRRVTDATTAAAADDDSVVAATTMTSQPSGNDDSNSNSSDVALPDEELPDLLIEMTRGVVTPAAARGDTHAAAGATLPSSHTPTTAPPRTRYVMTTPLRGYGKPAATTAAATTTTLRRPHQQQWQQWQRSVTTNKLPILTWQRALAPPASPTRLPPPAPPPSPPPPPPMTYSSMMPARHDTTATTTRPVADDEAALHALLQSSDTARAMMRSLLDKLSSS